MNGTLACSSCALLCRLPEGAAAGAFACPRCLGSLRHRKPQPIQRSWALLLSAALLYVPANVFPVMTMTILGKTESDTILSGVEELWTGGM